jgi:hypothetical protein
MNFNTAEKIGDFFLAEVSNRKFFFYIAQKEHIFWGE